MLRLGVVEFEIDQRAFTAANPVALHGADFFGPALKLFKIAQEFVGVVGDAQEPLFKFTLLDESIFVTPAAAIHHLLVGEHGATLRAPVDAAFFAIRQTLFIKLEEEPLIPAVVVGKAGGDFAGPIVGEAEAVHLRLHFGDVVDGPLTRRSVVLNGGIFGGKAEGIPAHGVKNVVAVHPHVTGKSVPDGVVADVAHVQSARGVRQHFENVVFLFRRTVRIGGVELGIGLPAGEPFGFNALGIVAVVVWPVVVRTVFIRTIVIRTIVVRSIAG